MAYQIRYDNAIVVKKVRYIYKRKIRWIVAVSCAALLVGLLQLEPVQDFFIPGDPEITKAAFSDFTHDLQAGDSFSDAAAAFCRQIIESDVVE